MGSMLYCFPLLRILYCEVNPMSIRRLPCLIQSSLFFLVIGIALFNPPEAYPLSPEEEINISVYQAMSSGVVNITSTVVSYDFFLNPIPQEGSGSGSIIDKAGHILTNYHVIEGAQSLDVTLLDGSKWKAKVIGVDPNNDLAVIRINAPPNKLIVVPFGDSTALEVGQKVLAIGNPFGLAGTLTVGIVSSLGRTMRARNNRLMSGIVQTDAAINPGNSGGPLLNSKGEMVGINTAIFSPVGASIGIGFAVPVNTAKKVVSQLIRKGYVSYPWLGITGQDIHQDLAELLGWKTSGVLIAEVIRGGPAYKAGLKGGTRRVQVMNLIIVMGGDYIVSLDGVRVETMDEIIDYLNTKSVGDSIDVTYVRDKKEQTRAVVLEELPVK
jgi:S1-C subfamily serine protease